MREAPSPVSPRIQLLLCELHDRLRTLTERIRAFDAELTEQAQVDERGRRLLAIPGIGALNATALVAAAGEAKTFGRVRDLAVWLGLVPRQATIGGRPRRLGITMRGSKYLRKMLVQGARAPTPVLRRSDTRLGAWPRSLLVRAHPNTAVVALAAKMARIVWALLHHGRSYEAAMPEMRQSKPTGDGSAGLTRSAGGRQEDGPTVDRRSGTLRHKMALEAGPLMRTRARRSPSWPRINYQRPDTFLQTA